MQLQIIKNETVTLTDHQAREVTMKYLQQLISPGDEVRVSHNELQLVALHRDERTAEIIRPATPVDQAAFTLLDYLRGQP